MMVSKKANDQSDGDAAGDLATPPVPSAVPVSADALPAIPEPDIATDSEGQQRPMSGGSFIRQPDGSIVRNPEA